MRPGISNRESAEEEARERREHAPIDVDDPAPEDASGPQRAGEADETARQTSRKAGARSSAQKAADARHGERPVPPSRKVAGAFGEEPGPPEERDVEGSSKPR